MWRRLLYYYVTRNRTGVRVRACAPVIAYNLRAGAQSCHARSSVIPSYRFRRPSTMAFTLDVDQSLFATYVFYSAVLVLKVFAMAPLTAKQRFAKMVFSNPEDIIINKKAKIKFDDVDVERVRRAHLNDLENIPFFIIACFGYILTKPNVFIATNLIRLFVASRIIHTIVYAVLVLPQPARGLSWGIGFATTIYMAVQVILYFV